MSGRPSVPGSVALAIAVLVGFAMVLMQRVRCPVALSDDPAAHARWPDMRVDLNEASPAELTVLPGIGPQLAEHIVADRARHGSFQSIDDLDRVERIGPATVRAIEAFVRVGEENETRRAAAVSAATIPSR